MKKSVCKQNVLKKMISAFVFAPLIFAAGCANTNDGSSEDAPAVEFYIPQSKSSITLSMDTEEYTFDSVDDTSLTLMVKGIPKNMLKWKSADPFVASVDAYGRVTSLSGGTTTIYGYLSAAPSKMAACDVTVSDPDRPVSVDPVDPKNVSGSIDIITCGDSIMTNYAPNEADQYGLGQALSFFFDESKASVDNSVSAGGRSSRMFWNAPNRWAVVKEKIKASKAAGKTPFVFFSFGHNDERSLDGADSAVTDDGGNYSGASFTFAETNQNGTVAGTLYDYMERFVIDTRELGGIPVLVTPFVRYNMSGSSVSAWARHDLTNKKIKRKDGSEESKGRGNYSLAIQRVAEKHNALFVDLTSMSAEYVEKAYADGKDRFVYIATDSTHETTLGALHLAEMVTDSLKNQGVLTGYIKEASPRIMVNKNSIAFGKSLIGGKKIQEFKISTFNVSGKITVSLPEGYKASLSKDGEFESPLTIDCDKDGLGYNVFVQFAPTEDVSYNGTMSISHDSVTPDFGNTAAGKISGNALQVSLTAGVRKMPTGGGTAITISYPMVSSDGKYSASALVSAKDEDGNNLVDAEDVSLTGLAAPSVKNDKVKTEMKVARVTTATDWPTNDVGAKLDGRTIDGKTYNIYMEYKIPSSGATLFIDEISMEIGSSGSGNMYWHIEYSDDAGASWTPIFADKTHNEGADKDSVKLISEKGSDGKGLGISASEDFYLRIYPAFKDTKANTSGRGMLIKDVKFIGKIE